MNFPADIWPKVLSLMEGDMTATTINTWFDDATPVALDANRFVLHTPSNFKRDIIMARYLPVIQKALHELFSADFEVVVLGEGELEDFGKKKTDDVFLPGTEEYTFERFVVGASNKFAHAAAQAVAERPAQTYNPLFIYGESGLGKTHLLYAIAHKIHQNHPDYRIVYIKGDSFTNELIQAIREGRNPEFREKYRSADVFLMDDVQFIAGRESTQEEMFHTFNTLYEAGQGQSRIENGIRLIKRQILADEETESPDLQKHQIKLRVVQAEYARFCKAVGLPTRSERLQVAGFGRSQSNRAVWAYKKAAPEQLRDVEIAGHKLYSVTDERIRAVPKPFFQGVSNKVNGLAQEYARGVLKKVQGLEVGTEAVVNFTKDGKCTGYYVGGQNSMKVKPPEMQVPYYSLHNHPSNGILSPEDIQQLIKRPQMQGIGAVGNAGALFTCEKVFGYSQKNAEGWFKALKKKYPLYKPS